MDIAKISKLYQKSEKVRKVLEAFAQGGISSVDEAYEDGFADGLWEGFKLAMQMKEDDNAEQELQPDEKPD